MADIYFWGTTFYQLEEEVTYIDNYEESINPEKLCKTIIVSIYLII